jgi:hypothetical protein
MVSSVWFWVPSLRARGLACRALPVWNNIKAHAVPSLFIVYNIENTNKNSDERFGCLFLRGSRGAV